MNDNILTLISYARDRETLEKRIGELVRNRQTFEIVDVKAGKQGTVVDLVESLIEAQGMTCRVRTHGRGIAAAALAIPSLGLSLVAGGAIAAHNLATRNPDYEVVKEMFGSDVRVVYQKRAQAE